MSKQWYMLTVVGEDRSGIVARVTTALFEGGCNLGEASMMRLGGNFTIMLMVELEGSGGELRKLLEPAARSLNLHIHIDDIKGRLHRHLEPDVSITVYGADRAGIVARVTGVLADAGLHILELDSDVAGSRENPIYVMHIEGHAGEGIEALRLALKRIERDGIEVSLQAVDTMVG